GNIWSSAGGFPNLFPAPAARKIRAAPPDQVSASPLGSAGSSAGDATFALDLADEDFFAAEPEKPAWYYTQNGASQGPLPLSEMRRLAATGQLSPQDHVWISGMADWCPAESVPQIYSHLNQRNVTQSAQGTAPIQFA